MFPERKGARNTPKTTQKSSHRTDPNNAKKRNTTNENKGKKSKKARKQNIQTPCKFSVRYVLFLKGNL